MISGHLSGIFKHSHIIKRPDSIADLVTDSRTAESVLADSAEAAWTTASRA